MLGPLKRAGKAKEKFPTRNSDGIGFSFITVILSVILFHVILEQTCLLWRHSIIETNLTLTEMQIFRFFPFWESSA